MLGKALESARAALKGLDADQVPAKLRTVVGHAGELTPDLARRLAKELDHLEWLRLKALEEWPEADPSAAGPHRASALFLIRPGGWAADLVGVVGDLVASQAVDGSNEKSRDRDALSAERDSWKKKAREVQKQLAAAKAKLAAAEKASRAPERALKAEAARKTAAERNVAEAWDAERAALQQQVEAATNDLKKAREETRRLRRTLAAAEARAEEARTGPGWLGRDPVDLARHLDDLMTRARRVTAREPSESPRPGKIVLPVGVAPDSAESIDVVLRAGGPVAVIVDGYNAGLALRAETASEVRSRLEPLLSRLRTLGGPALILTVVWDSSLEHAASWRPGGGVDVRFAPPGVPADDVVVEISAAAPRSVVITNDREVRERAERAGALALWSDALVAWSRRRR